jgi:hypothetical protein
LREGGNPTSGPEMYEGYFGVRIANDRLIKWIRKDSGPSGSLRFPGFDKPYVYDLAKGRWDRSEFDEYMRSIGVGDVDVAVEKIPA